MSDAGKQQHRHAAWQREPYGEAEVARIAKLEHEIAQLRGVMRGLQPRGAPQLDSTLIGVAAPPPPADEHASARLNRTRAEKVRQHIRQRQLRGNFLPTELIADPVWDMLLDLYAAQYEGGQVSVSSLCIAAAVPTSTALRWIKTLTRCGWFIRTRDERDGRRVYIHLSDDTSRKLDAYFDTVLT
jgi:DNA-binding MarR family transcriptional regulator